MNSLSSSQFTPQAQPSIETPLSLSSATTGSAAQATAWRNKSLGGGKPLSFSSKTSGSTFKWDDGSSTASLPKSDTGASFGRGE
jgi:hypothetical protein